MKGQVFTVAKLHYINGVVYLTAHQGTTDLQTLADNYPKTTKSGKVKHPLIRVRTLARLAEGIGLLNISKRNKVEITDLGKKYYDARLNDKWILSKAQKEILCDYILSDYYRTETIYSITTLFELYKNGYVGDELAHHFALNIGKDKLWKSDVTYRGFTKFVLSYIEELGLLEIDDKDILLDREQSMKKPAGIVDVKKNPFSTRSWIEQSHGLTSHRGNQINSLFGKTVEEINNIEINNGKYPAFVGIRWGFAEVKNNIFVQTKKWLNRIYYDDFGKRIKKKNPPWSRDELVLALDLYFRCPPQKTSQDNPEIIKLSQNLNALPIHPRKAEYEKFRNPNGVYMKLCNFLRFDPDYEGEGLKAGSKLEKEIWNEFYKDKGKLSKLAKTILENAHEVPKSTWEDTEEEEFEEGKILTRLHKIRERSPHVSAKKKKVVLKRTGRLECEVCGFDFETIYGEVGKGFAECHHTKPVSKLRKNEKTKLSDLSILCANCHRIIHRSRPMMSVSELKSSFFR